MWALAALEQSDDKCLVQTVPAGDAVASCGPDLPKLDAPLLQKLIGSVKICSRILRSVPGGHRIEQTLDLVVLKDAGKVDALLQVLEHLLGVPIQAQLTSSVVQVGQATGLVIGAQVKVSTPDDHQLLAGAIDDPNRQTQRASRLQGLVAGDDRAIFVG